MKRNRLGLWRVVRLLYIIGRLGRVIGSWALIGFERRTLYTQRLWSMMPLFQNISFRNFLQYDPPFSLRQSTLESQTHFKE